MPLFAALDVSKKDTQVHVVNEQGKCLWRGKVLTNPDDIARSLEPYAPALETVGLETGSWSAWLYHGLRERGFSVACMDARQAHAALSVTMNKTDANDAEGLAHLLRTGLFRPVRVKPWDDLRKRALLRARATLVRTAIDLSNTIRGALRGFGISLSAGPGSGGARAFERRVEAHLAERQDLAPAVMPLLNAWRAVRQQVCRHDRAIRAEVQADVRCQLLMTVPGVGHLNAVAFVSAIGDPAAFPSGRTAAAWIGLTPRRYQSGQIDMQGRISRHGDKLLRSYLYEAAAHILTRAKADSALKRWGTALREKIGFKRANVAVARKLAVTLFAMLRHNRPFEADGVAPA